MRKIFLVQIPGILIALLALLIFQMIPSLFVALITLAGGIFLIYLAYSGSQPIAARTILNEEKRKKIWIQNSTLKKAILNELIRPVFYLYPVLIDAPLLLHLGNRSLIYFSPLLFFLTKIIVESFVFRISLLFHERFLAQRNRRSDQKEKQPLLKKFFSIFKSKKTKDPKERIAGSGIFIFISQIMNITLFVTGIFFIYFSVSSLF